MYRNKPQSGFTLIELIVSIAIVAILAGAVFAAIDPAKRFADSRNAQRRQAVDAIADAIKLYQSDNEGNNPTGIDTSLRMLGTDTTGCDINCGTTGVASSGTIADDTQSEFNAGTYSNTQWDNSNTWIELSSSGQAAGTGTFTSSVHDTAQTSDFTTLTYTPERPTGKELPNNAIPETAYTTGNADMTGNVLLMHMNESSGTITDSSGNGNNGTNSGATYGASGRFNTAMSFSGSNYINSPNSSSLSPGADLTMMAWINWDGGGGDQNILTKESAYEFRVNGGNINFATNPWAWRGGTTSQITTGTWYHVAITHDGNGLQKIYINGNETYSTGSGGNIVTNTQLLSIGGRYGGPSSSFRGDIDEVAIFNRVLAPTEIANIYKRGALKFQTQVRSCDDAACSGESFIGPDGTGSTYYEWGTSNPITLPLFTLTNVTDNQYFQYRNILTTSNATNSPELKNLTISYDGAGGGLGELTQTSCLDISSDLSLYLKNIPQDPEDGSPGKSYFAIKQTGIINGINVISCSAELGEEIIGIK